MNEFRPSRRLDRPREVRRPRSSTSFEGLNEIDETDRRLMRLYPTQEPISTPSPIDIDKIVERHEERSLVTQLGFTADMQTVLRISLTELRKLGALQKDDPAAFAQVKGAYEQQYDQRKNPAG